MMFDNMSSIGAARAGGPRARPRRLGSARARRCSRSCRRSQEIGVPATRRWRGAASSGPRTCRGTSSRRLNAEIRKALASPPCASASRQLDTESDGGTPEEFRALVAARDREVGGRREALRREGGLMAERFDLLIRNATIVDGTGAPRFAGRHRRPRRPHRAHRRPRRRAAARREIDASGPRRGARFHRRPHARRPPDAVAPGHGAQGEPGHHHGGRRQLRHLAGADAARHARSRSRRRSTCSTTRAAGSVSRRSPPTSRSCAASPPPPTARCWSATPRCASRRWTTSSARDRGARSRRMRAMVRRGARGRRDRRLHRPLLRARRAPRPPRR